MSAFKKNKSKSLTWCANDLIKSELEEALQQLSSEQRSKLNDLKSLGHNNEQLNLLKLCVYKWDLQKTFHFYQKDEFCVNYLVRKRCPRQQHGCQYKHEIKLIHAASVSDDNELKWYQHLCEYLLCTTDYKNDPIVLYCYAYLLKKLKTYQLSEKIHLEALKMEPNNATLHNNLANMLQNKDVPNFELAQHHYQKAIELNPNKAVYYNNMANLLIKMKQFEKSIEYSKKALTIDAHDAEAYLHLAAAYYQLNKWDQAIEAYDNCIKLDANIVKIMNVYGIDKISRVISSLESFNQDLNNDKISDYVLNSKRHLLMQTCIDTIGLLAGKRKDKCMKSLVQMEDEWKESQESYQSDQPLDNLKISEKIDEEWQADSNELNKEANKLAQDLDMSQYWKYMELVEKQKKRLNHQIGAKISDINARIDKTKNELLQQERVVSLLKSEHNQMSQKWDKITNLLDALKQEVASVSNLDAANDELKRLQNEKKQLESSQKELNSFESLNVANINRLKLKYAQKWPVFEKRWYEWNVDEIICYLKYKMDAITSEHEINWDLIQSNMESEHFKGEYLNSVDKSDLKSFGVQHFLYKKKMFGIIQHLCQNNPIHGQGNVSNDHEVDESKDQVEGQVESTG